MQKRRLDRRQRRFRIPNSIFAGPENLCYNTELLAWTNTRYEFTKDVGIVTHSNIIGRCYLRFWDVMYLGVLW